MSVVELRRSCSPDLREAVEAMIEQIESTGRVTGFAMIVFGENGRRQPISSQVFSVPNLTEAIGAVTIMQADLTEEFRHNEGYGEAS